MNVVFVVVVAAVDVVVVVSVVVRQWKSLWLSWWSSWAGFVLTKWMIFKNHPPSPNHMYDGSKWTTNYWDDARMTTFLV